MITRLARVGYDNAIGFLKGGFNAWIDAGDKRDFITTVNVNELLVMKDPSILDVRKTSEYNSEHLVEAINAPLDFINESMLKINPNKTTYIHCASGYRSVVFISILQARGYRNLVNINGGFKTLKESDKFKMSDYHCQTTLL